MADATFRGSAADVRRLLRALAAALAGRGGDPRLAALAAQAVQARMGLALLSKIQQDFITKSRGGTGEDGVTWPPLAPSTLARRRAGKGVKGTPKGRVGLAAARRMTPGRDYDILRDTGLLLKSLGPGVAGPSGDPLQVLRTEPGRVTVGTRRYPHHHTGTARLPQRAFWDPQGRLPASHWAAVRAAAANGVREVLLAVLRGGGV